MLKARRENVYVVKCSRGANTIPFTTLYIHPKSRPSSLDIILPRVWLAKWCKIPKVYMLLHSMFLLIFTSIFIHIQQPNLYSRNIFIHIYLCISYSRLYLLTFTKCLHSHSVISIHIHDRNIHSAFSAHHLCASVTIKHGLRTTDFGLRTGYKTRTQVVAEQGLTLRSGRNMLLSLW